MTEDLRVAVIGLGKMGAGIARNIQKAGFPLTVYNRTASKTQPFVDAGAAMATSAREAAAGADVVLTSLMGDESVKAVVEGSEGILAGLRPGAIHVGTSTISPACATELAPCCPREPVHRRPGARSPRRSRSGRTPNLRRGG